MYLFIGMEVSVIIKSDDQYRVQEQGAIKLIIAADLVRYPE